MQFLKQKSLKWYKQIVVTAATRKSIEIVNHKKFSVLSQENNYTGVSDTLQIGNSFLEHFVVRIE